MYNVSFPGNGYHNTIFQSVTPLISHLKELFCWLEERIGESDEKLIKLVFCKLSYGMLNKEIGKKLTRALCHVSFLWAQPSFFLCKRESAALEGGKIFDDKKNHPERNLKFSYNSPVDWWFHFANSNISFFLQDAALTSLTMGKREAEPAL